MHTFQAKKSPRAKGSEAGMYLVGLRDSKEASVTVEEFQREQHQDLRPEVECVLWRKPEKGGANHTAL